MFFEDTMLGIEKVVDSGWIMGGALNFPSRSKKTLGLFASKRGSFCSGLSRQAHCSLAFPKDRSREHDKQVVIKISVK